MLLLPTTFYNVFLRNILHQDITNIPLKFAAPMTLEFKCHAATNSFRSHPVKSPLANISPKLLLKFNNCSSIVTLCTDILTWLTAQYTSSHHKHPRHVNSMPIRYLFVDMNAYFASVEQQLQPQLRGKPVGIIPMLTETTCCIAASYEAKARGVKTGTRVSDARKLCPGIRLVQARVPQYVEFHHRIVAAVDSILPVEQVFSIDEMSCKLEGKEQQPDHAWQLGQQVKHAIRQQVGEYIRCSVGLAPNRFLAKVATDLQKPDGQTLLAETDLPERLLPLELTDLPGIGTRMYIRLVQQGVRTIADLYRQPKHRLREIWGGIIGERWWHLLRGELVDEAETHRRTVGQSHVLPPQFRTKDGAKAVMLRLIDKAAVRLRRIGYFANRLQLSVGMMGNGYWNQVLKLGLIQDTQTLLSVAAQTWDDTPPQGKPLKVSITLFDLTPASCVPQHLFTKERSRTELSHIVDKINSRFGNGCMYYASLTDARGTAPSRIAFTQIPTRDEILPHHNSWNQT